MLLGVLILLILITVVGAIISKKLYRTNHPSKNRPFTILFCIALISALLYIFGAKKMEPSIDIILSWMMFTMGMFFSSGIVFFTGFLSKK